MPRLKTTLVAVAALGAMTAPSFAQDVTLRLHQMLPEQATIPAEALTSWAEKVEEESDGRIEIELYHSMQLGGTPPQLVDQVSDGVVDLIWTVIGYTPGRFPSTEVFELPFMMTTGEATSKAIHEYCEEHCQDEFSDFRVIAWHAHGPGLIHSNRPVNALEDMEGLKIRGGSRMINELLEELGAEPVGMPVPAVPEGLSKGVIDATTIPWEVTPALKVAELVENHTGFSGANGLYTQTFVFGMNHEAYDNLPDDLKEVIDDNSGIETAAMMGRVMDKGDEVGLQIAEEADNNIVTLDEEETERWMERAAPIVDSWAEEMTEAGKDGEMLVEQARELIGKYTDEN